MSGGQQRKAEDTGHARLFFFFNFFFFCCNASHGVEIGHPVTHVIPLNFLNSSERKIKCQIRTIDFFYFLIRSIDLKCF